MDLTAFSSISSALGVLAPLCTVALFLWVILRTESRHTLLYRLWQLVHGNQEISDPEVRAFISEQNSLMSFRFIAGVPVSTLEHARQLIQWTKRHNVEMFALRVAGGYFDPDLRQIRIEKLPSKLLQSSKLFLAALAVPIAVVSGLLAYTDSATLKIKATDRWFLMSESEARPVWPLNANAIRKTDCSADISAITTRTTFTEKEVGVLCEVLNHDGTPSYIKDSVKGQRRSSMFLIIVTLVAAWILVMEFMSGYVARRLAKRKLDPELTNDQLNLDFGIR